MTEVLGVKVGDVAAYERIVTAEDIEKFAEVSGDTNPLHRDRNTQRRLASASA